jgi:hypothetical protein
MSIYTYLGSPPSEAKEAGSPPSEAKEAAADGEPPSEAIRPKRFAAKGSIDTPQGFPWTNRVPVAFLARTTAGVDRDSLRKRDAERKVAITFSYPSWPMSDDRALLPS